MKNLNQSGIGPSIRRFVSILMMLAILAVANVAKADDLKNDLAHEGTNTSFSHTIDRDSTFGPSPALSGESSLDGASHLFTMRWAYFCFTIFGTAPLDYPLPSGSVCYVPEYNVYGIAR